MSRGILAVLCGPTLVAGVLLWLSYPAASQPTEAFAPAVSEADWDYEATAEFPPHPFRADPSLQGFDIPTRDILLGTLHLRPPIPPHSSWPTAATLDTVRHFRIAFRRPLRIGAIIGDLNGCVVSYLRRAATPPGDVTDETQWATVEEPHGQRAFRAVVFPPGTETQAIRLTVRLPTPPAKPEASRIAGLVLLAGRLYDHGPDARVEVESYPAGDAAQVEAWGPQRLTDGTLGEWRNARPEDRPISPADPEWVVLSWPAPRKLSGVWLVNVFGKRVAVDAYVGGPVASPALAPASAWKEVGQADVPVWWRPPYTDFAVPFDSPVSTTAIRVRIIEPLTTENPDIAWITGDGQRRNIAWIGEVLALEDLGDRPAPRPQVAPAEHPPIAIRYRLPKAGEVTLAINDAAGRRVRNLVAGALRKAGPNVEWWDGCDDAGKLVPPGTYQVSGVVHDPLHLRYQFTVYWSGRTPWLTPDGTGGWLSDHAPPRSVAVVGDRVFLGAAVAESGHTIMALDLDGRKLWGTQWLDLAGAGLLTAGGGKLYVGSSGGWIGPQVVVSEVDPANFSFRRILQYSYGDNDPGLSGIAVLGRTLFVSYRVRNEVVAYDMDRLLETYQPKPSVHEQGKTTDPDQAITARFSVQAPGQLVPDESSSSLLVVAGKQVVRLHPASGQVETVIGSGLEEPAGIALGPDGTLFVSDRGAAQQVKVFSPDGQFVRAIGEPGGRTVGSYNPRRMANPAGLAVDARGRLWVAEEDYQPKRISVWDAASGKLLQEFLGGPEYGGGGWLDPRDKTKFYYKGMEFALDWRAGTWRLARIFYRMGDAAHGHVFAGYTPDRPIYFRGRKFMVYDFHLHTGYTLVTEDRGDGVVPLACVGTCEWATGGAGRNPWATGARLSCEEFFSALGDRDPFRYNFSWTDLSGDGLMQAEEIHFYENPGFGQEVNRLFTYWGNLIADDLTIYMAGGPGLWRLPVSAWTPKGAPIYDLRKAQPLGPLPCETFQSLTALPDGGVAFVADPILGLAGGGSVRWTYPNPWPGVHGSHHAPSAAPGRVIGASRCIGRAHVPGLGHVFVTNGNKGELYLFTADGLLVATLFRDCRAAPNWGIFPEATRGMRVDDITLQEECFGPTFTGTADGHFYLCCGHHHCSIVEIEGLDTARRFSVKLDVAPRGLAACRDFLVRRAQASLPAEGLKIVTVSRAAQPPTLDGDLSDWAGASFAEVKTDGRLRARFSLRWDDTALYVAAQTWDTTPLSNKAADPRLLFKGGDCVDLQLGLARTPERHPPQVQPGDLRILWAVVDGKPLAVFYRYCVPGTPESAKVVFASPVRRIAVDAVEIWREPSVAFHPMADGYTFEAAVPWSRIGSPSPTGTIPMDFGVLFSAPTGDVTAERVYWSNKAAGAVSDVPSEAEVHPQLWGWARFTSD